MKVSVKRKRERRFPIHISKFEDALQELKDIFKESGKVLFFYHLVMGKNLVPYLMALMVLYQEGLVDIEQERPYEDLRIIIKDNAKTQV